MSKWDKSVMLKNNVTWKK